MTRQKEAKRFLLKAELLILVPLRNTFFLAGEAYPRRLIFFNFLGGKRQQGYLVGLFFLDLLLSTGDHWINGRNHSGAGTAEAIQRSSLDEAFQDPFCDFPQADANTQIQERKEWPVLLTGCNDFADGFITNVFDPSQTVNHRLVSHDELAAADLDIRLPDFNVIVLAGGNVLEDLILIADFRSEQGGHEFHLVVGLQIRRMVRNERIRGGVRFVETVFREFFHQVKDFRRLFLTGAILDGTVHEKGSFFGHGFGVFLPHRSPEQVCAAEGIPGDNLRDLHDLFLIDDNPVGVFQAAFQRRQRIGDVHFSVLALDEFIDHAGTERAGPVQRQHSDDVFKAVRAEHTQVLAHTRAFHLKHAVRIAPGKDIVGIGVRQRKDVKVGSLLSLFFNGFQGVVDQGHGPQTKEVELHEPHFLDHFHIELGDKFAFFPPIDRQVFIHRLVGNHHTRSVRRCVT